MESGYKEISFAGQTKEELARTDEENKCCTRSELAGFIRSSGTLSLVGSGKMNIKVTTDSSAVARRFKRLIKDYFRAESSIMVGDAPIVKSGHVFEINIIDSESCEMILRECGILLVREGCNYISDGIYGELVKKKCCKKAYLSCVFLGVGTINNPEKGYHVEFVFNTEKLASDARKLINSFGLKSKITKRKKHYVVYLKEAEQISDLLSIIGASEQLFKFEDTRIYKEIRNKTNRISNCDHANLDKSVDAAMRQIDAIKLIENGDGLKSLPDKLREIAEIRLSNPEASLKELGELLNPPMSKSGINHRLNKIMERAESGFNK